MAHDPYLNAQYGANHYPELAHAVGLGIQYDGYDHSQPTYYHDGVQRSYTNSPYLPNNLPATPQSNTSSGGRRTRSGRSITRSSTPHSGRDKSSPKTKKKAAAKSKAPQITQPLSILTKHMADVPLRDMQAWVNRPAEERQKEVARRNGYITRPMNSFMLYRSAYAERTKAWCAENNHQVVSSVSGESWPLEPPEVREFYNELAKVERTNHQNAHPDYKFSPSKPGYAGSKKRKSAEISDEESLLTDDPDGDWAASHGVRQRPAKRFGRDAGYPARNAAANHIVSNSPNSFETSSNYDDGAYRSSWEANNIGRPLPAAIDSQRLYGNQYYRSHVEPAPYPYMGTSVIENVKYAPVEMRAVPSHTSLFAAPGHSSYDLQDLDAQASSLIPTESHIDPTLFGYETQNAGLDSTLGAALNFSTQTEHYDSAYAFDAPSAAHDHTTMADPGYQAGQWPDHTSPFFEQPNEFDPLFDEHPHDMTRKTSAGSGKSGEKPVSGGGVEKLVSPKAKR